MSLDVSSNLLISEQKQLNGPEIINQCEVAEPCKQTEKQETNFNDLPTEILEYIFQYYDYLTQLSDEKLVIFHKLGVKFARIAIRHFPKRKLCFNGCYNLKTENLLHALSFQDKPLRVKINDCYWLPSGLISRLITSVPLQELRVINFDLSCEDVKNLLQLELTKLSMKWTSNWVLACPKTGDHSEPLWTTLKSAKVLLTLDESCIAEFPTHFLCHCPNLEKLKVTKDNIKPNRTARGFLFRNLDPQSSSYSNAVNDLDIIRSVNNLGDAEIKYEFRSKEMFSKMVITNITTRDRTIAVNGCEYKNLTESKYRIKKEIVKGLMLKCYGLNNFWEIAENITEKYGAAENPETALNLHYCANFTHFPTGLQLITGRMNRLTYLDITMSCIELTDEDKELVIESVSGLKNLKTLFMNTYFISFPTFTNENVDKFKDISEDAIEKSLMGLLTKCCKHISFLKLLGNVNTIQKDDVVPEANLAAISKLEHLLELHLVDILTLGSGESLALITKGCTKLHTFQLKNVALSQEQKSVEECFLHSKNIKEINIYQKLDLSEQLINNLSGCLQLEKLGLEGVTASLDQLGYLNNSLLTMGNLFVLRLVTQNTIKFPTSLIWNLALINDSKPAFRYVLRNLESVLDDNVKDTNNVNQQIDSLIERQWPPVHQNMMLYSSLKC